MNKKILGEYKNKDTAINVLNKIQDEIGYTYQYLFTSIQEKPIFEKPEDNKDIKKNKLGVKKQRPIKNKKSIKKE